MGDSLIQQPRGPRTYKSRRERPCDFCRLRKVACRIDVAPPCAFCVAQGASCTFVDRPAKRKRSRPEDLDPDSPAGNNVDHAESQDQPDPESVHEDHEETSRRTRSRQTEPPRIQVSQQSSRGPSPHTSTSTSPTQRTNEAARWNSRTPSLSTIATSDSPQNSRMNEPSSSQSGSRSLESSLERHPDVTARITGDTGESNRYLLHYYNYNGDDECFLSNITYRRMRTSSDKGRGVNPQDPPLVFMLTNERLVDSAEPRVDRAVLDNAREEVLSMFTDEQSVRLVRLFFRYVYPYFPILSQSWFFSTSDTPISRIRSLPLSLLTALYSTALAFIFHDDLLITTLAHSAPSRIELYRICWMAINHELHAPRLATLQACLLLEQRGPTNQYLAATPFKSSLMGWTVSLAHSLGLSRDCSGWITLPAWERRLRTRIWWAVYSLDRWIALGQGTPCLINSAEFDVPRLTPPPKDTVSQTPISPPTDPLETPAGCAHFYHLVNLSLILADIHDSYFTVRASTSTSHNLFLSLDLARGLRGRLTEWKHAFAADCPLPSKKSIQQQSQPQPQPQPNGNPSLDLAYLVATVSLFRALLRPLESESSTSPGAQPDESGARAAIRTGALTCAREAVEFLETLVQLGGVWNAFWHSWSQANFAIVSTFLMQMLLLRSNRRVIAGTGPANEADLASRERGNTREKEPHRRRRSEKTIWHERIGGEMEDLVTRWRWAMRIGGGSGGWGISLMALGLLRVDSLMVSLEKGSLEGV